MKKIELTEGDNKFIHIKNNKEEWVISKDLPWHKDIYKSIEDLVNEKNVLGGGRIYLDEKDKEIFIYDRSGNYGPTDNLAVKKILEEKYGTDYLIKTENPPKEKIEELERLKKEAKQKKDLENMVSFKEFKEKVNEEYPEVFRGLIDKYILSSKPQGADPLIYRIDNILESISQYFKKTIGGATLEKEKYLYDKTLDIVNESDFGLNTEKSHHKFKLENNAGVAIAWGTPPGFWGFPRRNSPCCIKAYALYDVLNHLTENKRKEYFKEYKPIKFGLKFTGKDKDNFTGLTGYFAKYE